MGAGRLVSLLALLLVIAGPSATVATTSSRQAAADRENLPQVEADRLQWTQGKFGLSIRCGRRARRPNSPL